MIKLISYFDNAEGNALAQKLFLLRQKYLEDEYIANDSKNVFDGTGAKGYIAELTLYSKKDISFKDKNMIRQIYSYFVG